MPVELVKSKQRLADHGEVFTPPELVEVISAVAGHPNGLLGPRGAMESATGRAAFAPPYSQAEVGAVLSLARR